MERILNLNGYGVGSSKMFVIENDGITKEPRIIDLGEVRCDETETQESRKEEKKLTAENIASNLVGNMLNECRDNNVSYEETTNSIVSIMKGFIEQEKVDLENNAKKNNTEAKQKLLTDFLWNKYEKEILNKEI